MTNDDSGETQKIAAATLVSLAQDDHSRGEMKRAGAAGPLTTLKILADGWLRSQAADLLTMLGVEDHGGGPGGPGGVGGGGPIGSYLPVSPRLRYRQTPEPMLVALEGLGGYMPTSPRFVVTETGHYQGCTSGHKEGASSMLLARFQAKLADNPELWMITDTGKSKGITDDHQAELAVRFKLKERIMVETEAVRGGRPATIMFIGKVPEIAPGFWIGVEFEIPDGKHDGSIDGKVYFQCRKNHGCFLRPSHIRPAGAIQATEADAATTPDAPVKVRLKEDKPKLNAKADKADKRKPVAGSESSLKSPKASPKGSLKSPKGSSLKSPKGSLKSPKASPKASPKEGADGATPSRKKAPKSKR